MKYLEEPIKIIKSRINLLYLLSSQIAIIDVICAFVDYSASGVKTIRPEILPKEADKLKLIFGKKINHLLAAIIIRKWMRIIQCTWQNIL